VPLPTYADVFRGYIKPALKGGLVMRKKTTAVVSAAKMERMEEFRKTMTGPDGCVVVARNEARKIGPPLWDNFIRALRKCAREKLGMPGKGPAYIGRAEYAKRFWKHK